MSFMTLEYGLDPKIQFSAKGVSPLLTHLLLTCSYKLGHSRSSLLTSFYLIFSVIFTSMRVSSCNFSRLGNVRQGQWVCGQSMGWPLAKYSSEQTDVLIPLNTLTPSSAVMHRHSIYTDF